MSYLADFLTRTEWFFFAYYTVLHAVYFFLFALAIARPSRYARLRRRPHLPAVCSGLEPSISVLMPVYNEGKGVVTAVSSALRQRYPCFEVVVVNDGSRDDTLALLLAAFGLEPSPVPRAAHIAHRTVRSTFRSPTHPNLVVIDKENGGKADAANAGLAHARHRLVCEVDGDCLLEPNSLLRGVQPFLERPETLAAGAALGVLNDLEVGADGHVRRVGVKANFWVALQTLEYVRAFLLFRLGFRNLGATPLISGAFGIYDREFLVGLGGYRRDTFGEDLEATLRFHRYARRQKRPYHVGYTPTFVCWTEVPDTYRTLSRQRASWQRQMAEGLSMNRGLLRAGGVAGWLLYPFYVLFEALTPVVMLTGFLYVALAYALGILSLEALLSMGVLVYGVGVLLSSCALLLEAAAYGAYDRAAPLLKLFGVVLVENLGYRQLHAVWQAAGLLRWLRRPGTSLRTDLALEEARQAALNAAPPEAG